MASPKGLGKGLGSLMGEESLQAPEAGALSIAISQVQPNSRQPRKHFDTPSLQDLADSIREHGVLQPITVRRTTTGYYQIIAGERRWRAAKLAGRNEIPAVILEADDRKALELGLVENLQREDLDPMEEAEGYATLIHDFGLTQEDVAARMGKSRSAVANALRLTTLPAYVRDLVADGTITAGHARAVLPVEGGEEAQDAFAKLIVENSLSVRQAENLAKKFVWPPEQAPEDKPKAGPDKVFLQSLEKDLSKQLGRKVSISDRGEKGKVSLEFYSTEDLNALVEFLQNSTLQNLKGGNA